MSTTTTLDGTLATLLEYQLEGLDVGLFMVSMDHCPSEQLTGTNQWMTTVLIVSTHVQHDFLAKAMAGRLRPLKATLRKYGGSTSRYRQGILDAFFKEFGAHPGIQVFAISAREDVIRSSVPHFLKELRLDSIYKPVLNEGGTRRVAIGPVVDVKTGGKLTFTLSENRAQMCLFIGHFVLRMRNAVLTALNVAEPTALNWNFFADKLPGGVEGDMARLFNMILSLGRNTGRIMWGHWGDSDTMDMDLLADNLAGALNAIAPAPDRLPTLPPGSQQGVIFYWERWPDEPALTNV